VQHKDDWARGFVVVHRRAHQQVSRAAELLTLCARTCITTHEGHGSISKIDVLVNFSQPNVTLKEFDGRVLAIQCGGEDTIVIKATTDSEFERWAAELNAKISLCQSLRASSSPAEDVSRRRAQSTAL
jgi:hypothetical protein